MPGELPLSYHHVFTSALIVNKLMENDGMSIQHVTCIQILRYHILHVAPLVGPNLKFTPNYAYC